MKKIIVVGAGFVGINLIAKLAKTNVKEYEITLFDKNNHHTFQPMLYQAATGFIPLNNVVVAIRELIRKPNVKFKMDEVIDILPSQRKVKTQLNEYFYDYLIVATGISYDYFGNESWRKYTFSLKTAYDAQQMKSHILEQFELAEISKNEEERKKYLTFIVIGAGATGVEITGALLDLINTDFFKTYKKISIDDVDINLIDSGDSILSAFPEKLSKHAYFSLRERGVKIHLNEKVTDISKELVCTTHRSYKGKTIIWSALLKGRGIGQWMGEEIQGGKMNVLDDLTHEKYKEIYFAGDIACIKSNPLPGLAAVAKQQGKYIAKHIVKRDKNKNINKFKYKNLGTMAIIKKHEAIADIFGMKLKGIIGWFMWGVVHITFLISVRNKFVVSLSWLSYYIFRRAGSITFMNSKNEKDNYK